jgi:heterotetrameric sarcosine oxidase gamma subunit
VSEPGQGAALARSAIAPAPPVVALAGWAVSGRRKVGRDGTGQIISDWSPLTKVQVRGPAAGRAAAALGVGFGRAARNPVGKLVVGSGPGEWLLLAAPGLADAVQDELAELAARADGEHVTWVDLTHGRALIRLTGPRCDALLALLCGIDLAEDVTPDGAAFRTAVAAVATDVIRDDLAGVRSYLLHCERSSGQYLFGALLQAGAEFGLEIDGFTLPQVPPPRST